MEITAFNSQPKINGSSDIKRSDTVGGIGLCLFFLFFQLNATVAYVGLSLTVLVFVLQTRTWLPRLKADKIAWIFLLTVYYILIYASWATHEFPETSESQRTAAFIWIYWLLFIPVAWQIFRHQQHLNTLLLILAASLLTRILVNLNWADTGHLFTSERTGFGLAETVFAPIAGHIVLGFMLLAPRLLIRQAHTQKWQSMLKISVWVLGIVIFLESLILSQTRGAWLAAALVFPLALLVRYNNWLRNQTILSIKNLFVLLIIVGIAGLFIYKNSSTIWTRVNSEQVQSEPQVVKKQLEGQEVLMTSSIGYRKILWGIGWRKWGERPFFGWGPGTTELLLKQEAHPLLSQSLKLKDGSIETLHMSHLHNLYLELLVRFGMVGALPFVVLPLMLLNSVRKARLEARVPWDYACLLFAGWGFMAIMVFFDFQLFKYAWRNYCVIWAALTYAVHLEEYC